MTKNTIFQSEIIGEDPQTGTIRTVDKIEFHRSTVEIINDLGVVAMRTIAPRVPYAGTEEPFDIEVHTPSQMRIDLPA